MNNDLSYEINGITKDGKPQKVCQFFNGVTLTEKQRKCGELKGKIPFYSEKLKLTFYVREGVDPLEVEQRYLEAQYSF